MVECVARNRDAAFQVAHVHHPAALGKRAGKPHFDLIRMAVHAAVARVAVGAGIQLVRRVETEFLPDGEKLFAHGYPPDLPAAPLLQRKHSRYRPEKSRWIPDSAGMTAEETNRRVSLMECQDTCGFAG